MPNKIKILVSLLTTTTVLITGCSASTDLEDTTSSPTVKQDQFKTPTQPPTLLLDPDATDAETQALLQQYVNGLASKQFSKNSQGIWFQTDDRLLANHQGTIPLPAASLTKIATTLAALYTFGAEHRFVTVIGTNGTVENGVLQGDLIVQGDGDPLLVWEEAIAIGNRLNQIGIRQVEGDLIVVGDFYMNFVGDTVAANLFREGINASSWTTEARKQYQTLPAQTPQPLVEIAGETRVSSNLPDSFNPLIRHYSQLVVELLKKMNRYSNNYMAQMLAESLGGGKEVAKIAANSAGVPPAEIQLINGSGLGEENRISPRAAVAMLRAIEQILKPYNLTLGDALAIAGRDPGILDSRVLPQSVVKSGSLNHVSALAGALPTEEKGIVWFAILNGGNDLKGFRTQQELLLEDLAQRWQILSLPTRLSPNLSPQNAAYQEIIEVKN